LLILVLRLIRKSIKTIRKYGFKELVRRFYVFWDRKIRPNRYYHFEISSNKADKRLLIITGEPRNATSYYRCEIPKAQLEKFNWPLDIVYEDRVDELDISEYKCVIFYRTPLTKSNAKVLETAKTKGIKTIFSVDDFVYRRDLLEKLDYTKYLDRQDAQRLMDRADGMLELMRQCDAGIASTEYLAKDMRKHIKGEVFVARNGILKSYEYLLDSGSMLHPINSKVVLGYFSGSETHDRDLALIWPVLKQILQKYQKVELWVGGRINFDFGEYAKYVKRLPFMNREKFMKMKRNISINLFPLEDTEFNRGKSEIKFTESALIEVPTIASKVGDMGSIITPQIVVLCKDSKDWYDNLEKLISDEIYRIKLGKHARKYVLENYSLQTLGQKLNDFIVNL